MTEWLEYAAGKIAVTGENGWVGGFVGNPDDESRTRYCYFDMESTGQENAATWYSSEMAEGKSSADMKEIETYSDWDFDTIRQMTEGELPQLRAFASAE